MATADTPRYLAYKDICVRIQSFDSWPKFYVQHPLKLSLAGFFYTKIGDGVRCYSCGGFLSQWNSQDDPVEEHNRFFPDCMVLPLLSPSTAGTLTGYTL